jgi:hypothetical protein
MTASQISLSPVWGSLGSGRGIVGSASGVAEAGKSTRILLMNTNHANVGRPLWVRILYGTGTMLGPTVRPPYRLRNLLGGPNPQTGSGKEASLDATGKMIL